MYILEQQYNVKIVNHSFIKQRAGTNYITVVLQDAAMADYLKQIKIIYFCKRLLNIQAAFPTKLLQ